MRMRRGRRRPPPVAITLALAAALALATGPVAPVSIAGGAVLMLAMRRLLERLGAADAARAAVLVLLLPGAVASAGTPWAAACLMALAAAIDRRHPAMLAWAGLAIGLDARAALVAPFFLALLVNRRVAWRHWPIAPLAALAAALPAWGAGVAVDPARLLAAIGDGSGAPNLWTIADALPLGMPLTGLALAAAIGAVAAYVAHFSARPIGGRALPAVALLAPLATAGLLPGMTAPCFLVADILALVLALARRDRASLGTALLVIAGSLLAAQGMAGAGAVAMIVATIRLARPLLGAAANDNAGGIRYVDLDELSAVLA